jgi:Icc-related predicted phosphoesterase
LPDCFFASDLHGHIERYKKLFNAIREERPEAVFLGGDLLPSVSLLLTSSSHQLYDFVEDFFTCELSRLKEEMGENYPRVLLVLGNDDGRIAEEAILSAEAAGLCDYIHGRKVTFSNHAVFGYAYIPPTPFLLKDWEKYDVSRYVDPGCVSPEEGLRSLPISEDLIKYSTIQKDLDLLTEKDDLERAIFLFHAPPYQTRLDRAALDGAMIDYVPLDVHVGSIAIKRFIEERQPMLTLHGHVHESARLSGSWRDRIGNTYLFSAAHDGPELALVRFDLDGLEGATRELF